MTERLVHHELHETAAASEQENLLGYRGTFRDVNRTSTGVKPYRSGMTIEAVWVKNESGGTLAPGLRVLWDNGTTYGPGKAVAGAAGDDAHAAGIVSDHITGTVANDEHFWLIRKGPCRVRYDGSANLAVRDKLAGAASGNTREYTALTDIPETHFGISIEAKTSGSAGDLVRAIVDFRD